jgi:hypothetical protein
MKPGKRAFFPARFDACLPRHQRAREGLVCTRRPYEEKPSRRKT